jgi:hypothetical protein
VRADLPLRFSGNDYTVEGWIKIEGEEKRGVTIASRFDHEWIGELAGGFRLGISHGRLCFDRMVLRDQLIERIDIEVDAPGDAVEEDITIIEIENRARMRLVGNRQLPVGRFCHVAAVCEGGWMRLFVDGTLDGERDGGDGAPFESMPLFIGCHPARSGPTQHFGGVIDRLRIWRHGLDESGIRAAMDGSVSRDDPKVVFHWRFEGKHDAVGNAAHMPRRAEPEIWISAGRCYVDGVMCENETDIRYESQPDCPHLALPAVDAHPGPYLAYLDCWDRVVSAIEDVTILEPALGGPDTAVRLRTIAQVRLLPLPEGTEAALPLPPPQGRLRMRPASGLAYPDNSLFRIEIHDPGMAAGAALSHHADAGVGFEVVSIDPARNRITIAQSLADARPWRQGQIVQLVRGRHATTATIVAADPETVSGRRTLQLDTVPDGGDPSHWRLRPIATFKWSRDNGAWAFSIASAKWNEDSGQLSVTVNDPNRIRSELSEHNWVELVNDDAALLGEGGPMLRIDTITEGDEDGFTIVLTQTAADPRHALPGGELRLPALLRRWEGIHDAASHEFGIRAVEAGTKVRLEDVGVEVEFSAGHYASGDYWVTPLRQGLKWPPLALPPQGILHRKAPLALLWFKHASVDVRDLRPVFAPVTEEVVAATTSPVPDIVNELKREGVEDSRVMEDFGIVPPDHCILGPSEEPRIGWRYTGMRLARRHDDPEWVGLEPPLSEAGPALAVALRGNIFCLQRSGDFFAIDPGEMNARTARRKPEGVCFAGASMVALKGKLHLLGGFDADGDATGRHIQYDPETDSWRELAPLLAPRGMVATAGLGGNLIAIGGSPTQQPRPVKTVDRYLAASDSWSEWPSLPRGRCGGAASAYEGRLYLFGGLARCLFGLRSRATDKVLMFSPRIEQWLESSPLVTARNGAQVVRADERLYVVGGGDIGGGVAPIEVFDARNGNWLEAPQPDLERKDGGVAMLDGTIYLVGGIAADGPTAAIETCAAEQVFYVHAKLLGDAD